ncbi:MAG TPA: diphosphomevalonate decarboxylase [Caldilineaceae bacterium]|nr:diphosphomevalonate decarboxylase [Caldilineaceae bacterium]
MSGKANHQLRKITVRAGSNIAFIKYWGVDDAMLNLPQTHSISMTLADAHTTTTVEWFPEGVPPREEAGLRQDQPTKFKDVIELDGKLLDETKAARLVRHLDRLRALAGVTYQARVVSRNNFPMASGIASSASGFAALTVAGVTALGLDLDATRLSAIARLGSGSACRSLFGGFVEWERGTDDATSVAHQLHSETHWALSDVVAVVNSGEKAVSSADGHTLAAESPLNQGRVAYVNQVLGETRAAIAERDLGRLGPIIEQDALAMHAVMMTSTPSLFYWQPGTIEVIQAVRSWRERDGLPAYFTIDAGPNVHVICEAEDAATVEEALATLPAVQRIIVSRPGSEPQQLADHLF